MLEIAGEARGAMREESGGWRFGANHALVGHSGGWFHDFAAGEGGHGALTLIAHLNGGDGSDAALAWLAQHPGDGRLGRAAEDDEDQSADEVKRIAYVRALWGRAQPLSPQAIQYLSDRSLDPAAAGAEAQLRWLSNWRGPEGAMLAAVVDDAGELVAIQITHITPDGKKSTVEPVRITIRGPRDWRVRGAFRLGSAEAPELTLVEGVEDAIAAMMAGASSAHACLGVGALGRAQLPNNVTRVTIARDDDSPGSPACQALGRGVARILLQGKRAAVTPRAGLLAKDAKDLNDLLKIDPALARRQLEEAAELKGMLNDSEMEALKEEISRASIDAYENCRKFIAKTLGWRTHALDDDRRKRQQARAAQGDDPVIKNIKSIKTEPWPDPVTDLGALLNDSVAQTKRFLIAPNTHHDTMALWSGHTHLLSREELAVDYTGRLAFQSPREKCGKSTGLKCVLLMSSNAIPAASLTPSAVFRAVDAFKISIMVEEGDNVFKNANPELLAVINSGADRMLAWVPRSEKTDDGKFEPRQFSCFAAVALTSINKLPQTLQDRSIVLQMRRATKDERPKKLTIRNRGGLIDVGRKFARWGADLEGLPDPNIPPDLFNRIEDRWLVLFQIAQLAGGDWPERCRRAALADFDREEADAAEGGPDGDLLADVWEVFYASGKARMFTKEICADLVNLSESPWTTANRGQPVNEYFLRAHLRGFLPDDAEKIAPRKWRDGPVQARGFHQLHLKDAFVRYLGKDLPSSGQQEYATSPSSEKDPSADPSSHRGVKHPSHPSHPSQTAKSYATPIAYPETDGRSQSVSDPSQERSGDGSGTSGETASAPNNMKQNQSVTEKKTDGMDGADILPPWGRDNAPAAPAEGPPSEKQNNVFPLDKDFAYPRGGRGRGQRKGEAL
jgi:putative DNA primase/helicase